MDEIINLVNKLKENEVGIAYAVYDDDNDCLYYNDNLEVAKSRMREGYKLVFEANIFDREGIMVDNVKARSENELSEELKAMIEKGEIR